MITVRKCCCFDLVTAGLIIGWVGVIGYTLACFPLSDDEIIGNNTNTSKYIKDFEKFQTYCWEANSNYLTNIVDIIISVCLIYGTMKRKRLLLLPWLIIEAIWIICLAIITVVGIVAGIIMVIAVNSPNHHSNHDNDSLSSDDKVPTGAIAAVLIIFVIFFSIFLALSIYFWIVIYSLYDFIYKGEQGIPGYIYTSRDVEGGGRQVEPLTK